MSISAEIMFVNRLFHNGFTPNSSAEDGLGGIELTTIHLSRALTKMGFEVALVNQVTRPQTIEGIAVYPFNKILDINCDIVVSSNDAIPFTFNKNKKNIYWMRNPLRIEKAIRRKQFLPLMHTHPHCVYVGEYLRTRQRYFPLFRSRKIIGHGVSDTFRYQHRDIASPTAVWSSQPQRGLSRILKIWVNDIAPKISNAKFMVFARPPKNIGFSIDELNKAGVRFMPRVSQDELANYLRQARVMIYPGYEDETFCSAAAEAICCGVPVITEGIGSLSERVTHGKTGIICKGDSSIASWAVRLLTEDQLWLDMQQYCALESEKLRWETVADEWLKHIDNLD